MNVVREINQINERELDLALQGASWHDEYKDSAYIFIGGLNYELTEGDVITIFSQYGEVMDVNLPRDKETGKPRGFAFLMYEDQRSTVLAVDNLNGAKVLERILRVDHVKDYKQKGTKGEDGKWTEAEEQSFNARPEMVDDDAGSESDASSVPEIDPEDPMYDYLLQQWREQHQKKKSKKKKSKGKHKDETPEERAARKAKKREKKGRKVTGKTSDTLKGVEALLQSLGTGGASGDRDERSNRRRSGSPPPRRDDRSRSRTPVRERSVHSGRHRSRSPPQKQSISPDHSGRRAYGRDEDRYTRERSPPRRRGY
ncbi:hypothetical protein PENSPDRAFT_598946 [Peniophora sp. CONT]|nr:hypothetical protein PENSPDRAFT_598946 [Peniophora sp. CONT]